MARDVEPVFPGVLGMPALPCATRTMLRSPDPAVLTAGMCAIQDGSSETRPVTVTYSPRP